MRYTLFLFPILLSACIAGDETVAAYGGGGKTWDLREIDGTSVTAPLALTFEDRGAVSGTAPCNAFTAKQTAPYPWFALEDIATTKMACPSLGQEQAFLDILQSMTIAETLGETLILSNDAKTTMTFTAR